jgi:hypothetical protein
VAALSRGQEAAALDLSPLSIDAVPWDGQAGSVLPAIERALGGSRDAAATPAAPVALESLEGPHTLDLFMDLGARSATPFPASLAQATGGTATAPDLLRDMGASAATPPPAGPEAGRAAPVTVWSPGSAWPASGPSAAEAEQALRGALAGDGDGSSLGAVAQQAAAGLSALEREVFDSTTEAVDAGLIRRATVLRLRLAVALATRPPKGTACDSAAVAELLSEIDQLLVAVKGLLDEGTTEGRASLESIRNALVKEAVDFSEACHEVGTAELPLAPSAARFGGRAAAARLLSFHAGVDEKDRPEEQRRRVVPVVVLAVILVAGGGYHLWRFLDAPVPLPPQTFEGAPAGTIAVVNGGSHVLMLLPGKQLDSAEFERFKAAEQRKGNAVQQISPSHWVIVPAAEAQPGAKP